MVIYSAVYGGYDYLKEQPTQRGVRYVMFTDRPQKSKTWDIVIDKKFTDLHPRISAKWYKTHSHELFPNEVSIWIDGSATVINTLFAKKCEQFLGNNDMMCFVHPEGRRCIYQEAEYCKDMEKYKRVDIMGQVKAYQKKGYPEMNGLWACGLVVRRPTPKVAEFNRLWWKHNLQYTYQDQLSFPVLLQETGVNFKTLWLNQHDNNLVTFMNPHTRED
jgi:hypothetical protein